ncbi:MAG: EamA family transporter [Bacteroidota bacterium]
MEAYFYLGMSVLMMVLLLVALREIPRFKMNLHHVVTTNYIVAASVGLLWNPRALSDVITEPGAVGIAAAIGGLFFGLFILMGITAQRVGVMYMTIVTKTAIAIPVLYAWLYFSEAMPGLRILGILLALGAIFLVNYRPGNPVRFSDNASPLLTLLLIVVLFVGNGATDTLFKVFNVHYQDSVPNASFTVFLFGVAAVVGLITVTVRRFTRQEKLEPRSLLGGVAMGIPNFFSIYFLTQSLQYFDATLFYPLNNTLTLVIMALIGLLVYRESFNRWNLIGLLLAVVAVAILV